jgi:hypothetical protein
MHHGCGYSVGESARKATSLMREGYAYVISKGGGWVSPQSSDWPLFYWHLRYGLFLGTAYGYGAEKEVREHNGVASDPELLKEAVAG